MSIFEKAQQLFNKSVIGKIDIDDMDSIINWPHDQMSVLFACADQLRRKFFGSTVDPCSIMNIKSGGCSEDCAYCSQSSHNNASVEIREMASPEEIIEQAETSFKNNLIFSVVSSGRKLSRKNLQIVVDALKQCPGEKHASLGILDEDELQMLVEAGVVCYHHNIETSRSYYPKIVTTHTWEDRVETVRRAKKVGLRVCCGGILGLGETWEQRKEFCIQIRDLPVDSIPLNFLNAIAGTRVSAPDDSPLDFLKVVSLFRIVMPDRPVRICGGREVNLGPLQPLLFYAGANGYISGGYLTTGGAGVDNDDIMIQSLGLKKRIQ